MADDPTRDDDPTDDPSERDDDVDSASARRGSDDEPVARGRRKKRGTDGPPSDPGDGGYKTYVEPPGPETDREFRLGLLLASLTVVVFYYSTACRWIGLGDTALVFDEMATLKVNSHVNNHTIAIFFGWLFTHLPVGELAFRVNLMSVLFGSIAMILMYVIAYRTFKRLLPSLLATFAVMVMHSMWWHSTIVENYAINACALLGTLLLLLKDEEVEHSKFYYGACVIAGLAVVNHVQMGTLSVAVFVYAILQRRKGSYGLVVRWLKMAGFFLIGFLPYLIVLLKDISKSNSAKQTIYWAIGGDFTSRMFDFEPAKVFRPLLMEFLIQFPSPMLLFAAVGVYFVGEVSWYSRANVAMTVVFFINTAFFAQFHTWDKFAFLLPSFLVVAYWAVLGMKMVLAWAEERRERRAWLPAGAYALMGASVLMPPLVYDHLAVWGNDQGFWHGRFNNNFTDNSHDCATYIANPNKRRWNDVDYFSRLLLEKLPKNSVFMDDDARVYYPLKYYFQRYYDMRPDVQVMMMNSWGFSGWGITEDAFVQMAQRAIRARPIFLVSVRAPHEGAVAKLAEQGIVARRFDLDDDHWVYRLEQVKPGSLPLLVHDMVTGKDFNSPLPVMKRRFRADEVVATEVRFARNEESVEVSFRWTDPTGAEYFLSKPFQVAPGNINVFSHLEGTAARPAGRWKVEMLAAGKSLGSASFEIVD